MKRVTWVAGTCAVGVALGLLGWAFAPRPVAVEVAGVSTGPFVVTIDEDGRTRLRERYVVSAPLAGRLMRVTLREGDPVNAGDVVAELLPALPPMLDERTRREYQARWSAAQAQVAHAQARVEVARVGLQQAQNEARRTEQLASQGFVSLTKLEANRLSVEAARKELDAAVQDRHVAGHGAEQAQAALTAVNNRSQNTGALRLRAPVTGRVLRVAQASETVIPVGAPVLDVGDTARQEVVAEVLTVDAVRVRPGAPVQIERWGGSAPLDGQVRLVEPSGFTKVSALGVEEQRVKVLIDITSPADRWTGLGDGYRVGVRIVTLSLPSAMQVPVSAVFPLPSTAVTAPPSFGVFQIEGGRARLTPVTIGARNGSHAWVLKGLAPGADVVVYPPNSIKDGARVAPRHA
jgi:HlyD family secretion protein